MDSLEGVGRVEVLQIEQPQLVQPSEVIVSSTVCMEKLEKTSQPVGTLLDALREKNRQIELTMKEKQCLEADILQVPLNDYNNIADMMEESGRDQKDIKELLLGSLTQVNLLTRLINERLSPEPESSPRPSARGASSPRPSTHRGSSPQPSRTLSDDDAITPTPSDVTQAVLPSLISDDVTLPCLQVVEDCTPPDVAGRGSEMAEGGARQGRGLPIVMSSAQLKHISLNLHRHLTQLMEVIVNRDAERAQLQSQLLCIQDQITASLRAATSQGHVTSRPHSGRSNASSQPLSGRSDYGGQSENSRPSSCVSIQSSASEDTENPNEEQPSDVTDITLSATLVPVPITIERLEVIEHCVSPPDDTQGGGAGDQSGDTTPDCRESHSTR